MINGKLKYRWFFAVDVHVSAFQFPIIKESNLGDRGLSLRLRSDT
jgi:hypothetical protein